MFGIEGIYTLIRPNQIRTAAFNEMKCDDQWKECHAPRWDKYRELTATEAQLAAAEAQNAPAPLPMKATPPNQPSPDAYPSFGEYVYGPAPLYPPIVPYPYGHYPPFPSYAAPAGFAALYAAPAEFAAPYAALAGYAAHFRPGHDILQQLQEEHWRCMMITTQGVWGCEVGRKGTASGWCLLAELTHNVQI
ncbi:hypothetical protein BDZ89DRAFT_1040257 [Hymenopellis radicata]|nr:hypothetical protein BDZ89DRAFT_1040257 [Hymenopellis radicata]